MDNIEQRAVSAQQALDAALASPPVSPTAQHQLAVLKVTADQVTQKIGVGTAPRCARSSDDSGGEHCRAEGGARSGARRQEEQAGR